MVLVQEIFATQHLAWG